ncbi:unnamed protein product [Mycena citricolor]|uniref:GH16 domain-containing protein n=1 Tax=Mycena citricolor TaxID=2018698 RepID=A0AAD2K1P8_9AGAR|nr:unnamed protein product [Mycena citricolor]CAK5276515.1 unnamed protein product [Mycena citricolor]
MYGQARPGSGPGYPTPYQSSSRTTSSSNLLPPKASVPQSAASRPSSMQSHFGASSQRSSLLSGSSDTHSMAEKFDLASDPTMWATDLRPEPDDALHNPDPRLDRGPSRNIFTGRGMQNLGCLLIMAACIVALFLGYPLVSHFDKTRQNLAVATTVNATGQVASMGNFGLIDLDTPQDLHMIYGYHDPSQELQLVFSDEFNQDGRSFYPGDDPYWEAGDLHYWSTGDLEWYDPKALTTKNGSLHITLSEAPDPTINHDLNYTSGMMTTWNKFCFTGGLIVTSVQLPGFNNVFGLWPAVWTMGNLGRAGYGATLDGMWPYSYDACDVGTLPNQTLNNAPLSATNTGTNDGELSFLPGQRLSRCTCSGESHPGPLHEDGTYVGRSAPEIDMFEAQIAGTSPNNFGAVSQSAQWAPFNAYYEWFNTSANLIIPDPTISQLNSYAGGILQQASSVVSESNQNCYQQVDDCFAVYGFQYSPGYDEGYITWIADNKISWTANGGGFAADTRVEIGPRPITEEPMYIIVNLGFSHSFSFIDFQNLVFPAVMKIDYIRVYQPPDQINVGCDTAARPTQDYINTYLEAYTNPNLTTWKDDFKQPVPKNNLTSTC